jgi:hypothetical protein
MKFPENRRDAFGIHLIVTCLLCIPIIIAGYRWYPGILFATEGGLQGIIFIAAIIIPVGPGLTLLTYVRGKKGLVFDIVFIICLQLSAAVYGMSVMYDNRPGIVAYYGGSYYVIPMLRFDSRGIDINDNAFFQKRAPAFVNIRLPGNDADRLAVKIAYIFSGLETAIDLYEPYDKVLPLLSKEGMSINEAKMAGIAVPEKMAHEKIRIFNLVTRYNIYAMAVNPNTGQPVQVLAVIKHMQAPQS